jgi:hypothetical protein
MTFFASVLESISMISLRPLSEDLSLMIVIKGGGGGGAGKGAWVGEGAGGPAGGRLDPDDYKSDKAGITEPTMEDKTEAFELKYAKLPPIALKAWCIDAMLTPLFEVLRIVRGERAPID